jgi:hypothetical protein
MMGTIVFKDRCGLVNKRRTKEQEECRKEAGKVGNSRQKVVK